MSFPYFIVRNTDDDAGGRRNKEYRHEGVGGRVFRSQVASNKYVSFSYIGCIRPVQSN